jgi:hypothetical protein
MNMAKLGESDYRAGGRERLEEAFILLSAERFGGCVYLAGRAVEAMLRAVIWKSDPDYVTGRKSLETGHNLRDILDLVGRLGVLQDNPLRDEIAANILHVGRLWWNDMRFISEQKMKSKWFELKEIGSRRTLKVAAREYYNACSLVIRRCEALWQS